MGKLTIGFIGLGIMGRPMAGHLMADGHKLVCYDIVPEAVQALVDKGAEAATSSREVAERADVVISMVPDSPDVEKVYLPEDGVLAGARPGT
ncbi:MAG: NAD(P)-binding domain-containing protein, partial [Anaerolineae bacterium]